jgi:hypothetical protein
MERILFIGSAIGTLSRFKSESGIFVLQVSNFIEEQREKLGNIAHEKSTVQQLLEFLDILHHEVSILLFKVITVDDKISKQLKTFRLIYLAGQGDFVDAFIDEADRVKAKLDAALIPVVGNDITQAFLRVCSDLSLENSVDEALLHNYSFEIVGQESHLKSLHTGLFGVAFQTNYNLEWPLNLFVSKDDIKR